MSQENVDIVREGYAAFNRGDVDAAFKDVAPDFEVDVTEPSPDFGVVRGFEAACDVLRQYWETFEDFHSELEEVILADDERVITRVRDSGRMSGSDFEISAHAFH